MCFTVDFTETDNTFSAVEKTGSPPVSAQADQPASTSRPDNSQPATPKQRTPPPKLPSHRRELVGSKSTGRDKSGNLLD